MVKMKMWPQVASLVFASRARKERQQSEDLDVAGEEVANSPRCETKGKELRQLV